MKCILLFMKEGNVFSSNIHNITCIVNNNNDYYVFDNERNKLLMHCQENGTFFVCTGVCCYFSRY